MHAQRQKVMAEVGAGEGQSASVVIVEGSVGVKLSCPHCGSEHMVRNGTAHDLQRYKCRDCRKTFNALTGTPLARLRMKGKWLGQTAVLRHGVTITKAAETLGVARSTAFRWRHLFLALSKTIQAKSLVGIAATDETYFLHSWRGASPHQPVGWHPRGCWRPSRSERERQRLTPEGLDSPLPRRRHSLPSTATWDGFAPSTGRAAPASTPRPSWLQPSESEGILTLCELSQEKSIVQTRTAAIGSRARGKWKFHATAA
jgi:transposase-like protein